MLEALETKPVPDQKPESDTFLKAESQDNDGSKQGKVDDGLNSGGKFGYLIASKGAAQFIFNPFVGHCTSRLVLCFVYRN